MSSSLFFSSASITLILLSILPFSTAFRLVDTDSDELVNGGKYYLSILPISVLYYGHQVGSFIYTQKKGCPLHITLNKTENSVGTPVELATRSRSNSISSKDRISIVFTDITTPCQESLAWTRTIDPVTNTSYITTGGSVLRQPFFFSQPDSTVIEVVHAYLLNYWISDEEGGSNIGVNDDEELLHLTTYPTTYVWLTKASKYNQLSSSS